MTNNDRYQAPDCTVKLAKANLNSRARTWNNEGIISKINIFVAIIFLILVCPNKYIAVL